MARIPSLHNIKSNQAFTLIELLVVIAIIAILAVVVVLTLNPAQLLAQSRDANRVSDIATLTSALNLYTTDQSGASSFSLGTASNTAISIYDPNASTTCGSLGLPAWNAGTGQLWQCATGANYRAAAGAGWIPVNFSNISAGSPLGALPVDPVNQTSSGLFYSYNTNGAGFVVTATLESAKYKSQYGTNAQTNLFPEVVSGGTPSISSLFNPSGLAGYWSLNEGSGTVAIDQSGNGNNQPWFGTPSSGGTYYTTGKIGPYAGAFNGSNNYASQSSTLTGAWPALSYSIWFKTTATGGEVLMSEWSGGAVFAANLNASTAGKMNLYLATTGGTSPGWQYSVGSGLNDGNWHFMVVTYNGANEVFYIDGSVISSVTAAGNIGNSSSLWFRIGAYSDATQTPAGFFNGSLDDARIYSRALSPAEVYALYASGK